MNTQPLELIPTTQTEVTGIEDNDLFDLGFSQDEVMSLIWLQNWYQTGGSDRIEIVRHLEFMQHLVATGKIGQ